MQEPRRSAITARRLAAVGELGLAEDAAIDRVVDALAQLAEAPVVRWIQFPAGALFLIMVAGDPESGWMYLLDRRAGVLYSLDLGDNKCGGYSLAAFDDLVRGRRLLRLARHPELIVGGQAWCRTGAA